MGGDGPSWVSMAQRFSTRASESHTATSLPEACDLFATLEFDLVLSNTNLPDGSAYPLVGLLAGLLTTLFFSLPVKDSCWWLPAIEYGQECLGNPAMRPKEFMLV